MLNQVVPEQWERVSEELDGVDVSPAARRALKFCETKRRDQNKAIQMIRDDPGLNSLRLVQVRSGTARARSPPQVADGEKRD